MNVILWTSLLVVVLLEFGVGMLAWRQLARRLDAMARTQQQLVSTDVPTSMLVTGLARVEARLHKLEHDRKPQPAPKDQPGDRAYELAQRMARNGADPAKIADACGIAMHEAELLCRLNAPVAQERPCSRYHVACTQAPTLQRP